MSVWWKRFKPNRSTLPAAALATLFCGAGLLLIWTQPKSHEADMDRYGTALAQTLAHTSVGLILNQARIELAVIANDISQYPEVAGVIFYGANQEIIALSGNTDVGKRYPARATLEDALTGYVAVVLNEAAFEAPFRLLAWAASLAILLSVPFITLGILQLSARGNRSLPIVSVPEPVAARPQLSFCLTANLHNQLALGRESRASAVADAMNLAQEVCAIHQGMAVEIPDRGVAILFDETTVSASQAICAGFLLQKLLVEFDTEGEFRCYLSQTPCPDSPAEMQPLDANTLTQQVDVDTLLTLAALAKADCVLLSEAVYAGLADHEKPWAQVFTHPLLEELLPGETPEHTYRVSQLPEQQSDLVDNQAQLILGFNQAASS